MQKMQPSAKKWCEYAEQRKFVLKYWTIYFIIWNLQSAPNKKYSRGLTFTWPFIQVSFNVQKNIKIYDTNRIKESIKCSKELVASISDLPKTEHVFGRLLQNFYIIFVSPDKHGKENEKPMCLKSFKNFTKYFV